MRDILAFIIIFGSIFFIAFAFIFVVDFINFQVNKSDGEHNVILTAVEKTPFNTKIYAKTEGESSQEDVYCVKNSEMTGDVYKSLQGYVRNKANVLLSYSQEYELFPWICRDRVSVIEIK